MGDIKTAAEIAREKLEKIGDVTDEERLKWKYVPEGELLAGRYMKEDLNLVNELGKNDKAARKYVALGAADILVRNIRLPKAPAAIRDNKKAMDGLKLIKEDKAALEKIFSQLRHVLEHYVQQGEQQKKQAYESLKMEFTAKMQQALKQQLGVDAPMKIDVERQPEFLAQWQKLQSQLDQQYIKLIDEYKKDLAVLA
jgi:hypothetical protein